MMSYTLYIVDDEKVIRDGLAISLEEEYQVATFSEAETALETMTDHSPDLVLLDISLPGIDGIEALGRIKQINPDIPVIMITAYEDITTVISVMKLGAYDYVIKPIHMDSLEVTIKNALETIRLRKEVRMLQERHLKENVPCFIGESDSIQDMMLFLEQVAKSPDTPILILGETGTGKELIASSIHYRSPNFRGNFATVNCAAIPENLIESEIFGYEKGAFSGAEPSGKKGLIENADGGTLFLDEVGDLNPAAQAKLLRFLEKGEFYRVGGTKIQYVKTRVVSATNKNLEKMIQKDLFRKDLYFRIGVIKLQVPSLNERSDDIIRIADYYLDQFNIKFGKSFTRISADAQDALLNHVWAGNVRELKNIIERGVLIGDGSELKLKDLGIEDKSPSKFHKNGQTGYPPLSTEGINLPDLQTAMEKHYIEAALKLAKGNESKAAELLHINHHTFRYRKKKI